MYLVNALIPSDRGISVVGQTRDAKQRDVRIEYSVSPQWPEYLYWPVLGVAALFFVMSPLQAQRSVELSVDQ